MDFFIELFAEIFMEGYVELMIKMLPKDKISKRAYKIIRIAVTVISVVCFFPFC